MLSKNNGKIFKKTQKVGSTGLLRFEVIDIIHNAPSPITVAAIQEKLFSSYCKSVNKGTIYKIIAEIPAFKAITLRNITTRTGKTLARAFFITYNKKTA